MKIEIDDALLDTYRDTLGYDWYELEASQVLENLIVEKLQRESVEGYERDELSGVLSIYSFINKSKKVVTENKKFVVANVCGLRNTNDLSGFLEGDRAIQLCADLLKKNYDQPIYRISGGRFLIECDEIRDLENNTKVKLEFQLIEPLEAIERLFNLRGEEVIRYMVIETSYDKDNDYFNILETKTI